MKQRRILNYFLILLFPFFLGITLDDCDYLIKAFVRTFNPPTGLPDFNDSESYHSGGVILAADSGRIYHALNSYSTPHTLEIIQGEPDLSDIYYDWRKELNIIVGANGTILISFYENPGWFQIYSPVPHKLNKINGCFSGNPIFAVGDSGSIIKSTDGGLSWNKINFIDSSVNLKDIHIFNDCNDIIVVGSNYGKYRSTDGGENWAPIGSAPIGIGLEESSGSELSYERIYFYNDSLGFIGGPNGVVLKTTNGGWNWEVKFAYGFDLITDVFFISPDSGAVVGTNGIVAFTTNGGDSWFWDLDVIDYLDGRDVKSIFALSRNHGFVVGEDGLFIFTAVDSTYLDSAFVVTSIEDDLKLPSDFILYQNYPNPFNPVTIIKYSIPKEENVKVSIYNLLGEEVNTLVNEIQNAGFHQVEWRGSDKNNTILPTGVYFYRLEAGSFVDVKKIMFLK